MSSSVQRRLEKLGSRSAATAINSVHNKTASAVELSALASLATSGAFGDDTKYAFEGITSAIDLHVKEDTSEKTASHGEINYNIYDENAARRARLDTLLRKQ